MGPNFNILLVIIVLCGLSVTFQEDLNAEKTKELTVTNTTEDAKHDNHSDDVAVDNDKEIDNTNAEDENVENFEQIIQSMQANSEVFQSTNEIKGTIDLLNKGSKEIILKEEYKDVTLVLGMTGSGKSTFAQWFAGDVTSLRAVDDGGGDLIIEDTKDKISSNSTIESKTIFPELIKNETTKAAYYDMPGFSDTRSVAHDISLSFFFKKVVDHASKIKIVLCVNYPSLRKGVDRQDFTKLLKHMTELITAIDKYRDSILLIATKVDNKWRNGELVADDVLIKGISNFLGEVSTNLKQKLNDPRESAANKKYYESSIKLIKALIAKDGDSFSRIALFRRPDEEGPLNNSTLLNDGRKRIEEKLKMIAFTSKNSTDFGYTISDKSKILLHDLVSQILDVIIISVKAVANDVKIYYDTLVKRITNKIKSFTTNSPLSSSSELCEAIDFKNKIKTGQTELSKLANNIKNTKTLKDVTTKIKNVIGLLGIPYSHALENITTQQQYLDFIKIVSGKDINTSINIFALSSVFQGIAMEIANAKINIGNDVDYTIKVLEQQIETIMKESTNKVKLNYLGAEKNITDLNNLQIYVSKEYDKFISLKNKINSVAVTNCIQELVSYVPMPENAKDYGKNIAYLQSLSDKSSNSIFNCVNILEDLEKYIFSTKEWYTFLRRLYERLSSYKIQRQPSACKYYAKKVTNNDEQQKVDDTNIKLFLEKCQKSTNYVQYDNVKDLVLDKSKFERLQDILQYTLKYEVTCRRDNRRMIIKAPFIKTSDLKERECNHYQIKYVEIYALEKFFIDKTIDKTGSKIHFSIISPTWEVIGNNKIILDGKARVVHHDPQKVTEAGGTGAPGYAGDTAGHFFGLGLKFVSIQTLFVSANGGQGGTGQIGGDGKPGQDGVDPKITPKTCCKYEWNCKKFEYRNGVINLDETCEGTWYGVPYTATKVPSELYFIKYIKESYIFYSNGTKGTDGGDGGWGGYGGKKGCVKFVALDNSTKLNFASKHGSYGPDGKGGRGGIGGRQRRDTMTTKLVSLLKFNTEFSYEYRDDVRADNGADGSAGRNGPGNSPYYLKWDKTMIDLFVSEAKDYYRTNLDTMRQSYLTEFYSKFKDYEVEDKC